MNIEFAIINPMSSPGGNNERCSHAATACIGHQGSDSGGVCALRQVIVSLRTGGQSAETSYDPDGRSVRVLWEDTLEMGVCSPVIGHTPSDDAVGMRISNNVYSRPIRV